MKTTKNNTFSLTIYRNEYNAAFVIFLARKYNSERTERTVTLYGLTEEECDLIMSLMYKEAEDCALAYPEFNTITEEVDALYSDISKEARNMIDRVLAFYNSPAMKAGELMDEQEQKAYRKVINAVMTFDEIINKSR